MKPILIFTLILFVMQNSNAQITDTMKTRKPEIDDSFENFDSTFAALKKNRGTYRTHNNEMMSDRIINFSNGKKTNSISFISDYSLNPIIGIYKDFYSNGNIKTKGIHCRLGDPPGFKIGKWYHFSEDGRLVEVVDHDEGYEFTYEQVFEFCEKRGISLEYRNGKRETHIGKIKNEDGVLIWAVSYFVEYISPFGIYPFGVKYKGFLLDAKSGNIIKETEHVIGYGVG